MKVEPGLKLQLYVGGDPEIIERIQDSKETPFVDIEWSSDPLALASDLEAAARWIRRLHSLYPTDHLDLWTEIDGGE